MTIDGSILSDVGSNVAHARVFRALASAFVRSGGLISDGDLAVTGDPSVLAVNIDVGMGLVPYGSVNQYYEPFEVDAPEQRLLNSNTSGSSRTDLIYLGVKSLEFGDSVNSKDIYVKKGSAGGALPSPDAMAAVLPLAQAIVPSGASRGTSCTISMLADTTAPIRDGGFLPTDLAASSPTIWAGSWTNLKTGAGGYGGYPHGAPFTPAFAIVIPQFPNDSSQAGFSTFAPGTFHNDFCDATNIHGLWRDINGNIPPTNSNFSARFLAVANLGQVG